MRLLRLDLRLMPKGVVLGSFMGRWDEPWPSDQTDLNQGCRLKAYGGGELT
jgi:hypothetical protein